MRDIDEDDDDFSTYNEEGEMTVTDILVQLEASEESELILTIDEDRVDDLKKSLSRKKAKRNQALKDKGLPTERSALSFRVLPQTEEEVIQQQVRLHVILSYPKSFPIYKIEAPEGL